MKKIIYFLLGMTLIISCKKDKEEEKSCKGDSFNRKEMLVFWADEIIVPAFKDLSEKTNTMNSAIQDFISSPSEDLLKSARNSWKEAYISWQKASIFQIGKAQEVKLTEYLNTYPTRYTSVFNKIEYKGIKQYVEKGKYNLKSEALVMIQGFPALDYLLNGVKSSDSEIVSLYNADSKWGAFLKEVSQRANDLTLIVKNDWVNSYRNKFVENTGNTATSSVNKMVNYYAITFYEKQLRENKIATPAGVRSNEGKIFPKKAEAYYYKNASKTLYLTALNATIDFFRGKSYDRTKTGKSLQQYLEFLNRKDLVKVINADFDKIKKLADKLDENFAEQVQNEQKKQLMVESFNALQKNLKNFKPDMMSAMCIDNTTPDGGADND